MIKSLYTAATGMEAQQFKMDVTANNLANANTVGFKRVRADFEDLLSETLQSAGTPLPQGGARPSPLQVGLGVRTASTTKNYGIGDMIPTDNPLDVAIQGPGFFRVQRPNGEMAYTRAGGFQIDGQGRLETGNGDLLDPPVTIPSDAKLTTIQIARDGTVFRRNTWTKYTHRTGKS